MQKSLRGGGLGYALRPLEKSVSPDLGTFVEGLGLNRSGARPRCVPTWTAPAKPMPPKAGAVLSQVLLLLPAAVEVTSIPPSTPPTRTGVCINAGCRVYGVIFFDHHWRRRYDNG